MRLRLAALTATVALAALALPGHAAAKPQITDATGDAVVPVAGLDIVSALFATKGKTTKVGRKTVYTPKSLEVTVSYAAAPETAQYASQAVLFDLSGCGEIFLQRFGGGTWATAECLEDPIDFSVSAQGNTLTFSLPFNVIGKEFKKGSVLTELRTWAGVSDPAVGYGPADFVEQAVVDAASTAASYKVA